MKNGPPRAPARRRVGFVVESGTDVRLVEGMAERFDLALIARTIPGGVAVSRTLHRPVPLELGPASRLRFALRAARWLKARRATLDLAIVQGYGLAAAAINLAARLSRLPTLMLVCSPIELYYHCRRRNRLSDKPFRAAELAAIRAFARFNARAGQGYVVLSRHLAEVVRAHGTRAPIHIAPVYGVETARFAPASEAPRALRRRLGLPEEGPLLFASSRVAPEKDTAALLEALARLREALPDVRLLHRSGDYPTFRRHAEAQGVADRVLAKDAVHPHGDLAANYQACDLVVQASLEEGLGFSPLEALACEVPVVATAVGGLRETIVDGHTGWTYPVGDVPALARAIGTALAAPDERARRARQGRRSVCASYDRQVAFAALEAACERHLAPPRG